MKTLRIISIVVCVAAVAIFCMACLNDEAPKQQRTTPVYGQTVLSETKPAQTTRATTSTTTKATTAATKAKATAKTTTKATTKAAPQPPVTVYLPTIPQADAKTQAKLDSAQQELATCASQFNWEVMSVAHDPLSGIVDAEIAFLQDGDEKPYSVVIKPDEKGGLRYFANGKRATVEEIKKYLDENGVHSITDNINAI